MPNGIYGDVRGRSKSTLLGYFVLFFYVTAEIGVENE